MSPSPHRSANKADGNERAPFIAGSAIALPDHRYDQQKLVQVALRTLPGLETRAKAVERFFARVGVKSRYLALDADEYRELRGFGQRNAAWQRVAMTLGERAMRAAIADAEIDPSEIRMFISTTVTGLTVPSLDARLMNRIAMRPDTKRMPLFGLGCVAGAAGVARLSDYLRAYPTHCALLLSVELCSLTVQHGDVSIANLISSGLFGDGAAAVVLVGEDHPRARRARPCVLGSRAHFFPQTERVMGWDVVDGGFKVVLGPEVPQIAREGVPPLVDALLSEHGLSRKDVSAWIVHPGGPAVMEGMRLGLDLRPDALEATRQSLEEVGNLSSASVLFLLDQFRKTRRPAPNDYGVLLAMGPAFCAEAVLLRW